MVPDIKQEEWDETHRMVKSLMMRNSLLHWETADARTVTILQDNGLLADAEPHVVGEHTVAVLKDVNHPDRLPLAPGPLIWHRADGSDSRRAVFPVSNYLFSHVRDLRDAALTHFEGLTSAEPEALGQGVKAVIAQYGGNLRSDDESRWRRAAVLIADAISDDFLCNLAGVRQGLHMRLEQVVYLPKVLCPPVASLLALEQPPLKPSEQMGEIEQIISDCAGTSSLAEACRLYYRRLGHLPLAGRLSLLRVVSDWVERGGAQEQVWYQVWEWANGIPSPLPRYHACSVFVQRPDLVPPDEFRDLWNEILEVVHAPLGEQHLKWTQAWRLRCELARHYASYIECNLPGMDGERIAASSLWLAEQVSMALEIRPEAANHFSNEAVPKEARISSLLHAMSHPPITPSNLRYATLYLPSLWSLSLQCLMGPNLGGLDPSSASGEVLAEVRSAIVRGVLASFPVRAKCSAEAVYGFEESLAPAASIWRYLPDDSRDRQLLMLVKPDQQTPEPQQIADSLKTMAECVPRMQRFIAGDLLVRAYTGEVPIDLVWEWVSGKEWTREVLLKVDLDALGVLVDALREIQQQYGDKWASHLPHLFAIACEEAVGDSDRRKFLFAAAVLSSMVSDRVSAIQRLVHSRERQGYRAEVDHSRSQLQALRNIAPPWMAARIRATLASLHPV